MDMQAFIYYDRFISVNSYQILPQSNLSYN